MAEQRKFDKRAESPHGSSNAKVTVGFKISYSHSPGCIVDGCFKLSQKRLNDRFRMDFFYKQSIIVPFEARICDLHFDEHGEIDTSAIRLKISEHSELSGDQITRFFNLFQKNQKTIEKVIECESRKQFDNLSETEIKLETGLSKDAFTDIAFISQVNNNSLLWYLCKQRHIRTNESIAFIYGVGVNYTSKTRQ